MRPLTDTVPKPLLEIRGKSLLVWHLEALVKAGIEKVVINHAWLGNKIEETLGDGTPLGLQIQYSPEAIALETAGGIYQALPLLHPSDYFLVINGDVFCPSFPIHHLVNEAINLGKLKNLEKRPLAHLVLVPNPVQHPTGDFYLQGTQVSEEDLPGAEKLTFSGIGLYHSELFKDLVRGKPSKLAPLLRAAMRENRVTGEKYVGSWHDVGTPQRLNELNAAHE
jgi:N-acetyl-alpha-D-muramate 1-phosphate uridylyltransferase